MTDTEFSASENMSGRLCTAGIRGLASRDAGLAREISAAAARLQVPPGPAAVQHAQVAIDGLHIARVRPFWHVVLGYAIVGEKVLHDAHRQGSTFWFRQMQLPRTGRNRFHIDIYVFGRL